MTFNKKKYDFEEYIFLGLIGGNCRLLYFKLNKKFIN